MLWIHARKKFMENGIESKSNKHIIQYNTPLVLYTYEMQLVTDTL